MEKATKATMNRLNKLNKLDHRAGVLIGTYTVEANNVADLISEGFSGFECNAEYGPNGIICRVNSNYDKAIMRGLCTRYPKLVECTLTHGNNQVVIVDVNMLSRLLMKEIA